MALPVPSLSRDIRTQMRLTSVGAPEQGKPTDGAEADGAGEAGQRGGVVVLPEAAAAPARLLLVAQLRHRLVHAQERGAPREEAVRAPAARGAALGGWRGGPRGRRRAVERHTETGTDKCYDSCKNDQFVCQCTSSVT